MLLGAKEVSASLDQLLLSIRSDRPDLVFKRFTEKTLPETFFLKHLVPVFCDHSWGSIVSKHFRETWKSAAKNCGKRIWRTLADAVALSTKKCRGT
jgi:hypothetical protein